MYKWTISYEKPVPTVCGRKESQHQHVRVVSTTTGRTRRKTRGLPLVLLQVYSLTPSSSLRADGRACWCLVHAQSKSLVRPDTALDLVDSPGRYGNSTMDERSSFFVGEDPNSRWNRQEVSHRDDSPKTDEAPSVSPASNKIAKGLWTFAQAKFRPNEIYEPKKVWMDKTHRKRMVTQERIKFLCYETSSAILVAVQPYISKVF